MHLQRFDLPEDHSQGVWPFQAAFVRQMNGWQRRSRRLAAGGRHPAAHVSLRGAKRRGNPGVGSPRRDLKYER